MSQIVTVNIITKFATNNDTSSSSNLNGKADLNLVI